MGIRIIKYNSVLGFTILMVVLGFVYGSLMLAPQTVNPDAQLLYPIFSSMDGIGEYFASLFSLKTYDVQPIRDLSLFIDWFVFDRFHLNIIIFQSLVFWSGACFVFYRILKHIFVGASSIRTFLFSLAFAVYPLFCATISWGVARKHILALFFILLATLSFLKFISDQGSRKDFVCLTIFYFLSVFSQPITLLWPFWALLYSVVFIQKTFSQKVKPLIPAGIVFGVCAYVNYIYYEHSPVFKMYYGSKTSDAFNLPDKILGIGHYFYQSILPYWPSADYSLGHWSVMAGILSLVLFLGLAKFVKLSKKEILVWSSFYFFPLIVILTNAKFMSDNYLLVPSVGLWILIFLILQKTKALESRFYIPVISILIFFWSIYSHKESILWSDPITYAQDRNFFRRPNCDSALNLLRKLYGYGRNVPEELKSFIQDNGCLNVRANSGAGQLFLIYTNAYILYYEDSIPVDVRETQLRKLGELALYPRLVYSAFLLKLKKIDEFRRTILEISSTMDAHPQQAYDPFVADKLHSYCRKTKFHECLKITTPFAQRPDLPYY